MSENQQDGVLPTEGAERQALFEIAQSMSIPLMQAMVGANPQALVAALMQALVTQNDYADVLEGLVDPETVASHPFWGFRIVRADGHVLGTVTVRKILTPTAPTFVNDLAQWLIVYAYVSTPQLRVAWGICRAKVDFFQSIHDGNEPAKPLLKLITP